MRRLIAVAAVSVVLVGCQDDVGTTKNNSVAVKEVAKAEESEPPPPIEVTSPDQALKSYWAVLDWRARVSDQQNKATLQSKLTASMDETYAKVATPAIYERRSYTLSTFDREIVEAKVETDTRATILATIKNSTPIPAGADVTDRDRERREQGDRFRYVLERNQDGWRVAEVWEFNRFYDKKWTKIAPSSTKPSVESFTFGGS